MRSFGVMALGVILVSTSIAGAATGKFSEAQLEEIMAPIALYPDAVLSTMCIAATYPLEVVEADRWRDKNPSLQGAELEKALAAEDWDASVKSLASFPDVLDRMSNNLDWTKDLGDAFLDQRSELMAAAQRLRGKAYDAGTLKTTPQQTVVKDQEAIAIAPASPETVYVPTYSPATAYGSTYTAPATPSYPSFWATPGGTATAGVLGFGAGIATTALIGSLFDWDDDDVYVPPYYARGGAYGYGHGGNVYVDRNTTVNADVNRANLNRANVSRADVKANGQRWQHDGSHRRGVGYRDPATAERFKGGRERVAAKDRPGRDAARGFEPGAGPGRDGEGRPKLDREGGDRPKVDRPAKVDRPGGGEGPHKRPDAAAPAARPKPAERPSRDSGKAKGALADARGGRDAVDASRRGAASRGVASRAGQGGQGGGAKVRERAGGQGGGKGRGALGGGGGGGGRGRGGGGGGGRGRGGGGGGGGGKGRGGGGRRR